MSENTTTARPETEEILQSPVEAETREGRVRLPSVQDRINLENHEAAKNATKRVPFGIVSAVCVPGKNYYG